jgi:hypothetical protein
LDTLKNGKLPESLTSLQPQNEHMDLFKKRYGERLDA